MLRICCLLVLLATLIPLTAAERGMRPMTVTDERGGTVTFSSSRALIIGNSAYTADWDELKGVREDVVTVQAALEQQGFAVQVAQNLTKIQMGEVMDAFIAEQAQDPAGRVVIYYAGHGQTVGTVGYLVPVDAPKPSNPQFKAKAYPISILKIKAQEAVARHVLFACDSCFSGSVFTPMRGANEYVLSAAREPVRMFLTAGSADETVPDVSFFRQEFVRGIGGSADLNRDGYVTGSELSTHIKQTVRDRAGAMGKKLTPQAGVSEQEGLNRGDIVFAVPNVGSLAAPPPVATAAGDLQGRIEAERQAAAVRQSWDGWQEKMSVAFEAAQLQDGDQRLSVALRTEIWQRFLRDWATDNPFSTEDERFRTAAQTGVADAATSKPAWATASGKDQYGTWADLQVAGVTQRFRWIRPGTFTMGSPNAERDAVMASVPDSKGAPSEIQHPVTLTRGFWLADSACTQALWQTITGRNPARFPDSPQNPVEQVSWDDCQVFLAQLNARVAGGFCLPTEAQWEYACRAGTTTAFSFGDTITPKQVNFDGNFPFGGAAKAQSRQKTVPVKSLPPNAWGLYEMHGNVWQMCSDWYGDISGNAEREPTGPSAGSMRVARGGSWDIGAWICRSAARFAVPPDRQYTVVGFRLASQTTPSWDDWQQKMSVAFEAAQQQAADQRLSVALRTEIRQRFLRDWAMDNPFSTEDERLRTAAQAWVADAGPSKPAWATASGRDQYGTWADLQVAGVTQRFRWIRPGTFTMGSPKAEQDAVLLSFPDITPELLRPETQRQVTLTQGFWLADSACTQELWQAITGTNPAHFKDSPQNPVEQVSWEDCKQFLAKLNGRVSGGGFRLPSEAQWEYACRAGTTAAFSFGSTITPEQANYVGDYPFGGAAKGLNRQKTVPVKSLPPNAWGLYEMHGNVWHWCNDWFDIDATCAERDPTGPASGRYRAARGGSWGSKALCCRAAQRFGGTPDERNSGIGFRFSAPATP